jgi:hypothetical protein
LLGAVLDDASGIVFSFAVPVSFFIFFFIYVFASFVVFCFTSSSIYFSFYSFWISPEYMPAEIISLFKNAVSALEIVT